MNPYQYPSFGKVLKVWEGLGRFGKVKQAQDHLPIYKLDFPDPIFRGPELKHGNSKSKITKNLIFGGPENSF